MEKKVIKIMRSNVLRMPGEFTDPLPQPPASTGKINQYTRRSFLGMFLVGSGVRKVARFYRVGEQSVETELREQLIEGGAFNKRRAA